MNFDCARSRTMTQEWADALWDIACTARALVSGHDDEAKIATALKSQFEHCDAQDMIVPEAGFTWRAEARK